jgi:YggT family protein
VNEFILRFVEVLGIILHVAILGRVIMSWLPISAEHPISVVLHQVTEPILGPIRRVLPKLGMLDFSPIVAILLIVVIQNVLLRLLSG